MAYDLQKRARRRKILITIILATIPCYCAGLIALRVGQNIQQAGTTTPTATVTLPTLMGDMTFTPTPESTTTLAPSATYEPTASLTPTVTIVLPTLEPTATHTVEIPTIAPPPAEPTAAPGVPQANTAPAP
jgi:hypothetical protein